MSDADGIYVGLMSGTSLDGISAAAVRFTGRGSRVEHQLLAYRSTAYTVEQRDRIASAMNAATAEEFCALGFDLGQWLADAAILVIDAARLDPSEIRAIASHGQTIWHTPRRATWQMGETAVIAERTGIDVVSDFRVRDVAAGGEGAPLVPIADALLYSSTDEWRLLQNIGGIGNVTVVPPLGNLASVRAFDTGPGVVLIDYLVRKLHPDLRFDEGGAIALAGRADMDVVATLMRDAYFIQAPPKSTGREYFNSRFADRMQSMVNGSGADVIATAVRFTAESSADAVHRYVRENCREMVVSGGGAKNATLMDVLADAMTPIPVNAFDSLYYDGEAKEAVAFALLAYLHVARVPGNVTGATGARGPRVLGKLTPA